MNIIKDGTGTGSNAGVDSKNRLLTKSTSLDALSSALVEGQSYFWGATVEFTSADESGLIYFKNNEKSDLLIHNWDFIFGSSNIENKSVLAKYHLAPTGGTLLSNGTISGATNMRLSDSNVLDLDLLIGDEGLTVTGANTILPVKYVIYPEIYNNLPRFILPQGVSVAITVQPPVGNTSMEVTISLEGFLVDNI